MDESKWMKERFFEPRGYELIGDEDIIGEGDPRVNIFDHEIDEEYFEWLKRIKLLCMEVEY